MGLLTNRNLVLPLVIAALAIAGTAPAGAGFASRTGGDDDDLAARLKAIDQLSAAITDMTADFTQYKHTPLLRKPMESKGIIKVRGDIMRWDTAEPSPSVMIVGDEEMKIYFPQQSLLEIYPLDSRVAQLATSPLPRLDDVNEHFTIIQAPWTGETKAPRRSLSLLLSPREESLREHVLEVRVLIDEQTGCVAASQMTYPDHERLEMSFTSIKRNVGLSEADVALTVPEGTTISHPLGKGDSASGDHAQGPAR